MTIHVMEDGDFGTAWYEVFHISQANAVYKGESYFDRPGWYVWECAEDGDPISNADGPYNTEAEAKAAGESG